MKDHVCCKDGYTATYKHTEKGLTFEGYNHISWMCGCPENGEMKNVGLPLYICCKDGYKMDEKTGLYTEPKELCKSRPSILREILKNLR